MDVLEYAYTLWEAAKPTTKTQSHNPWSCCKTYYANTASPHPIVSFRSMPEAFSLDCPKAATNHRKVYPFFLEKRNSTATPPSEFLRLD